MLDKLQDTDDNKQLKAKMDEKIQALEAEQATPESLVSKQKDLDELLGIKKSIRNMELAN